MNKGHNNKTAKIICTDNFNREHVAESLVADNVNSYYAKDIVDFLNSRESEGSPDYYKVVDSDYNLWRVMEEFV